MPVPNRIPARLGTASTLIRHASHDTFSRRREKGRGNHSFYIFVNRRCLAKHKRIRKAENAPTVSAKPNIALMVVCLLRRIVMRRSIKLNDEFCGNAHEICNVATYRHLPPKFGADPARSQIAP